MDFNKLPAELLTKIMGKCNFKTIIKMNQSCQGLHNIIKRNKLNNPDVTKLTYFCDIPQYYDNLKSAVSTIKTEIGLEIFIKEYVIYEEKFSLTASQRLYSIFNSIKTLRRIKFGAIVVNESFIKMLRSSAIDWRKVSVELFFCRYDIARTELLPFWRMFKDVGQCESLYSDFRIIREMDIINDEMMREMLPTITINDRIDRLQENPNISDKTLQLLGETRPTVHCLAYVANFSTEGIMRLFRNVVQSRDPSVQKWFIGAIRLNLVDFYQAIEDFYGFTNKFTDVIVEPMWTASAYRITIEYTKLNSEERGVLAVALMKPFQILAREAHAR